jgi:nucleoside-diphosphate-sugar epimerase
MATEFDYIEDERTLSGSRILVTGGTGYVGSALVPYLARNNFVRVFCSMHFGNSIEDTPNTEFVNGDIRDSDAMASALEGQEVVIHLAGIVTDDLVDMNRTLADDVNVNATKSMLQLAREKGVKRFIYASSSSVYGSTLTPVTEGAICQPETHYALSKLDAEKLTLEASDVGFDTVAIRSATLCGPAPRMRLDTIVNVFSKQAWFDGKLTVHDGTQIRSNLHVEDAVEFYSSLVKAESNLIYGRAFNATSGNHNALEIATIVCDTAREWGKQPELEVNENIRDTRQYQMSTERAKNTLGWSPSRSIVDAINANFKWFQQGHISDPNNPIYYNTKRMEKIVNEHAS